MKLSVIGALCSSCMLSLAALPAAATDTIYTNGKIYTVDAKMPWAEAVAIKDGKFTAVGTAEHIAKLATDNTEIVDLGGWLTSAPMGPNSGI